MAVDPRLSLAVRAPQFADKFQTGQINASNLRAQDQATQQSAEAFPLLQQGREQNLAIGAQNLEVGQQDIDLANLAKAQKVSQAALQFARTLQRVPSSQRAAFINTAIQDGSIAAAGLPPEKLRSIDITDEGIASAILQGEAVGQQLQQQAKDFTLSQGQTRFGPGGEVIASVDPKPDPSAAGTQQLPSALIKGLSPQLRASATEAFTLSGGGKDGVKAAREVIQSGEEVARREDVPELLTASYPNASPAEKAQLEAAVAGAKTVESGLKRAAGIRTEQRRLKKAKGFQQRAVTLLNGILESDQIGDVIGSIEGKIDFKLFSDAESELIADIDEAQNILTADNMDLMTGVLSESDIQILKNLSSGALNRTRSKKRFISDVEELRDKLASKLVQTVDDTGGAPTVTTQEQFNALPSGAEYIGDNGQKFRKP